jgi:hypothetical protein
MTQAEYLAETAKWGDQWAAAFQRERAAAQRLAPPAFHQNCLTEESPMASAGAQKATLREGACSGRGRELGRPSLPRCRSVFARWYRDGDGRGGGPGGRRALQVCERGACAARRGQDGVVIRAADEELVAARLDDEARRDPDAIDAVFKELNAADEAIAARRDLGG